MTPRKAFKNVLLKGENAGDQHFILLTKFFYSIKAKNFINKATFNPFPNKPWFSQSAVQDF